MIADTTARGDVCCTTWWCPGTMTRDPVRALSRTRRHHSSPAMGSLPPRITRSGTLSAATLSSSRYVSMRRSCFVYQTGPTQVVAEHEHVDGRRLPQRVATQRDRLSKHRAVPTVGDRADDHDGMLEVRALQRQVDDPLSAHRVADQHGTRDTDFIEDLGQGACHLLDRQRRPGFGQAREAWQVDGVHVGAGGQQLVQRGGVAVRYADAVHDDERPTGGRPRAEGRQHPERELADTDDPRPGDHALMGGAHGATVSRPLNSPPLKRWRRSSEADFPLRSPA